MLFTEPPPQQEPLREAMTAAYRMDEDTCVETLLAAATLSPEADSRIQARAKDLVEKVRTKRQGIGGIETFLNTYELTSEEGIALMCMAEALLRIPDKATVDRLIRDKITAADWKTHIGKSESFFVNATTWALMLTGKIMTLDEQQTNLLRRSFNKLTSRSSEPVIRKAVGQAMKIMGKQFVMGQTITEALKRAQEQEPQGYRHSYDMLGEAARTDQDAKRYFISYQQAILAIGKAANKRGIVEGPGISVKLSALHPRYEESNRAHVLKELTPKLLELCKLAKSFDIGFTVDAEEANRLDLSLDIIAAVFKDPALQGWEGFGLAVQAYQKRAPYVLDWLADLARSQKRRLMVRLIKGAYWDAEIKNSQENGFEGYPVFTRKASTDVSYMACAKKIIANQDAFYPQFATHNAYSVAVILELMGENKNYEFQRLHGMGQALYDIVANPKGLNQPCRVYSPVGSHEDLLPYLVRRLLENGANTSFVNRIADAKAPLSEIIANPVEKVRNLVSKPHPRIVLPKDLLQPGRANSKGLDLSNRKTQAELATAMTAFSKTSYWATPLSLAPTGSSTKQEVYNPATQEIVGYVVKATPAEVEQAITTATQIAPAWAYTPADLRADVLDKIADLFEAAKPELMALAVREAGKTINDAQGEVREAIDFCHYYAAQARQKLAKPEVLAGPTGESNQFEYRGRGPILCISPWNFPLAIFTGQVVAALAAGNPVLAKPAEQTPLIAAKAVALMHQAGIPKEVLQLVPGRGAVVGAALVSDERIKGVMFTGSTSVAAGINRSLAARTGAIVPLIAETGGQNAMIVDSSALLEQVVVDAVNSAFGSAGQRCSALRVIFIQDEVTDKFINLLKGAMAELVIGDPSLLTTDIGPVIDDAARAGLQAHADRMQAEAELIYAVELPQTAPKGSFFTPKAYRIDSLSRLTAEEFGPILHVVSYKAAELDKVIADINATGFGLTLGIHSRIDETVAYILQNVHVGNAYVNRNMVGAVVGVQPFGGEGLSGTGPKAGGPNYLPRLCTERSVCINTTAAGGNASLLSLQEES